MHSPPVHHRSRWAWGQRFDSPSPWRNARPNLRVLVFWRVANSSYTYTSVSAKRDGSFETRLVHALQEEEWIRTRKRRRRKESESSYLHLSLIKAHAPATWLNSPSLHTPTSMVIVFSPFSPPSLGEDTTLQQFRLGDCKSCYIASVTHCLVEIKHRSSLTNTIQVQLFISAVASEFVKVTSCQCFFLSYIKIRLPLTE